MRPHDPSDAGWSSGLATALLSAIADARLTEIAAGLPAGADQLNGEDLRAWLGRRSWDDPGLPAEIMRAWRDTHSEIATAARLLSIEQSAHHCEAMARQFGVGNVLLELLTDPRENGWELAHWVVDNLPSEPVRREMEAILETWSADRGERGNSEREAAWRARIVVFGGHVRDENKMTERLFGDSVFDVRWRPFEKGTAVPTLRTIIEAMASADGALVVTSMVSHNIMHMVKRIAREQAIPFRAIVKATDRQLKSALVELFPETRGDWNRPPD